MCLYLNEMEPTMNLIIDEGNTRIKLAVFSLGKLIDIQISTIENCAVCVKEILDKYQIKAAILSSVTNQMLSVFNDLDIENKYNLSYLTELPFKIKYKTPKTLGVDRIALVAAAWKKNPNECSLVIDAGTCITYDFINAYGEYYGGAIAPGIEMRFKSMHAFTKKLPLLTVPNNQIPLIGVNTQTSMESGVLNGVMFEVLGMINAYEQKHKKVNVMLTGGNANLLEKQLKNKIFVDPNFLLNGLNQILTYQTKS